MTHDPSHIVKVGAYISACA